MKLIEFNKGNLTPKSAFIMVYGIVFIVVLAVVQYSSIPLSFFALTLYETYFWLSILLFCLLGLYLIFFKWDMLAKRLKENGSGYGLWLFWPLTFLMCAIGGYFSIFSLKDSLVVMMSQDRSIATAELSNINLDSGSRHSLGLGRELRLRFEGDTKEYKMLYRKNIESEELIEGQVYTFTYIPKLNRITEIKIVR